MAKQVANKKLIGIITAVVVLIVAILIVTLRPDPVDEQPIIAEDPVLEEPVQEEPDEIAPPVMGEFTQSPMLDGRDLPPVAERLPLVPKIVNETPAEHFEMGEFQIGRHGGTLRTIRMSPLWDAVAWTVLEEPLVNSPGRLGEEITPNVVESFEYNAEMSEFTFRLREGMRWSDGDLLTTEDVLFTWNNVISNEYLTPTWPLWLRTGHRRGGSPATLEVVDDYAFRIIFDGSYGGFLMRLAVGGYHAMIHPSHHMKQYHIDYANEDELATLVAEYGYEPGEWFNLYHFMAPSPWNNGRTSQMTTPTLGAYILVEDAEPRIFERNPFYWKVDPIGQQLPYIDRIASRFVMDLEAASVKMLAGEIDFAYEWVPLEKTALYMEQAERGGYEIVTTNFLHRTAADIFFNLTYPDETWRSVVRDIRFRQAVNLAIDKEDLVDTVYLGFAKPGQVQGTEFDLERANQLLDEMGMAIGGDGYRTAPNGEPFIINFTFSGWMTQFPTTAQLISEQLRELNLRVTLKMADQTLIDTMTNANEIQATTVFSHGPVFAMWDDWQFSRWGRLWWLWYETDGEQGEEPPAEVLEFYETVFSINTEPLERLAEIRGDIDRQMAEHLWYLIPVQDVIQVTLINANLQNYPRYGLFLANSFAAEQFWFDE